MGGGAVDCDGRVAGLEGIAAGALEALVKLGFAGFENRSKAEELEDRPRFKKGADRVVRPLAGI